MGVLHEGSSLYAKIQGLCHGLNLVGGSGKLSGLALEAGRLIEAVPVRLRAPTPAILRAVAGKGGAP